MRSEPELAPDTAIADDTPIADHATAKRPWMRIAKWVIVVSVLAGLTFAVRKSHQHWNSQPVDERLSIADLNWRWLIAAAAFYALGLMPATIVLATALKSLGVKARLPGVIAAQLIGHLAKYVPGKAMVIIVRAALLNRSGAVVSIRAATLAIGIETLTLIASGATVAFVSLLIIDPTVWLMTPWLRDQVSVSWIKPLAVVFAIASALCTLPGVLRWVMARRVVRGTLSFHWTSRNVLVAWFWNLVAWGLMGASTTAIVMALPGETLRDNGVLSGSLFASCLAAVTLAYVAGFLSLLPGGAGVRELALTALLSPIAGTSGALVVAIVMRMTHLVVESFLATIVWSHLAYTASKSSKSPQVQRNVID